MKEVVFWVKIGNIVLETTHDGLTLTVEGFSTKKVCGILVELAWTSSYHFDVTAHTIVTHDVCLMSAY